MTTKAPLLDIDYAGAAWFLDVDSAAIRAVAEIEGQGHGFLPDDQPLILYERHIFSRLTSGKYDGMRVMTLPDDYNLVSDPHQTPAGHYGPSSVQHIKLQAAVALDREAGLRAASYGLFQVLGDNCEESGYTLQHFINAMYDSHASHLRVFVAFIWRNPALHMFLKNRDWVNFARLYNGPNYAASNYHGRISDAYEALKT